MKTIIIGILLVAQFISTSMFFKEKKRADDAVEWAQAVEFQAEELLTSLQK
jgi:uncharacterized protein YxeA